MMPNVDHALRFASRGWHVLPCVPGEKVPLTPHGYKDATTDSAQIAAWWTLWPDANVAIACGPSGLVIIDVDTKNGAGGLESWADLRGELGGAIEDTVVAETPSGGLHYYYLAGGQTIGPSVGKLAPGLDVRAGPSYVVAPPSCMPQGGYAWAMDCAPEDRAVAPLPTGLLGRLLPVHPHARAHAPAQQAVGRAISEGARNNTLTSLAGAMRRRGASLEAIEAALLAENARCTPPLADDEVRTIASSVARYAPAAGNGTGAPPPKAAADLTQWVRECLGKRASRETKLQVAEAIERHLLADGRLLVDLGQDAARGGRPYLVAGDGAVWALEADAVPTRLVLHDLGLNGSETTYRFVLEHLHMTCLKRGRRVTLARWQRADGNTLYVSCGPAHLVHVSAGVLGRFPNGTDDVWFAGDASYPEWEPADPVDPATLPAFRPRVKAPAEVPGYTAETQTALLCSWLAALLSGVRPLPLLLPLGPKGGGKSNLAKAVLAMLLGPGSSPAVPGQDVRDYWSLVTSRPFVLYDNLDGAVPSWLPDVLAATITGISDQRRELYTDAQTIDRPATAALAITTRTAAFARPDIAERCLPLLTGEFADADRLPDGDLLGGVATHRDGLLSWCALEAAALLRDRYGAPPGLPLRFVDFARLVWAYVRRHGRGEQAAYLLLALRQAQALTVGEADPLTEAIVTHFDAIAQGGFWEGSGRDLTRALTDAGADLPYLGGGKRVANCLREAKATLVLMGIELSERQDAQRHITFTLRARAQNAQNAQSVEVEHYDEGVLQGGPQDCALCADCASPPEEAPAFVPSADWQDVPEGVALPPGLVWRVNLATGRSEVRWPDLAPEPKSEPNRETVNACSKARLQDAGYFDEMTARMAPQEVQERLARIDQELAADDGWQG